MNATTEAFLLELEKRIEKEFEFAMNQQDITTSRLAFAILYRFEIGMITLERNLDDRFRTALMDMEQKAWEILWRKCIMEKVDAIQGRKEGE